jgi:hypothetical protein
VFAAGIATQFAPPALQRCHWKAVVCGWSPVHVPSVAVIVYSAWGVVSEIVGGAVFVGAWDCAAVTSGDA